MDENYIFSAVFKEKNYTFNVNDIIALCHIIDDFEEFRKKIITVISPKYNRDFVFQLWDISKYKFRLGARKTKKFYMENKSVIDTINKYSNIKDFICHNYDWYGEPETHLGYIYNYILENRDKLDKILAILWKMKMLEINNFIFNEQLDFSKETYKVYTLISDNHDVTYLDNLVAIPSCNSEVVSYKTKGSSYKMKLGMTDGIKFAHNYRTQLYLNDLTFNSDRLPNIISKEEIFNKIFELPKERKQEYSIIKDSVDLGTSIADLYSMFEEVNNKINNLSTVDKKEELIFLLSIIREAILKMKDISCEYDKKVADSNPNISETFLNEEKNAYVKRRETSNLHIW